LIAYLHFFDIIGRKGSDLTFLTLESVFIEKLELRLLCNLVYTYTHVFKIVKAEVNIITTPTKIINAFLLIFEAK